MAEPDDAIDPRGDRDLVGHTVVDGASPAAFGVGAIDNIIVAAKTDRGRWIEDSTRLVGPWRARFQSTYMQWAMAINGLHVAAEKYRHPSFDKAFKIDGLRLVDEGKHDQSAIAVWDGPQAADGHIATLPKMYAWGFIELYAAHEEFVFEMYRTYLTAHPDRLLGREASDKELAKLLKSANGGAPEARAAWETAWKARLDSWHRRKLYEGLKKVLLAYVKACGLKKPASYKHSTPETWGESLEALALIRNCLVHGAKVVPEELAVLCAKPHVLGFNFRAGAPLALSLYHLQAVELFANQLLTALNLSLAEHEDAGR